MTIWAIADLHLSFGTPNKKMDIFGERWTDHATRLKANWIAAVQPDDLVLIPGDISWGLHIEEAVPDLEWIAALPGTKVMIRGNHDYWWHSLAKIERVRPPSIHYIQNNAFLWNDVAIGGARLWDSMEYQFDNLIENAPAAWADEAPKHNPEDEKIFEREVSRLELSLKEMAKLPATTRIVMTHYPPISTDLQASKVDALLQKYNVAHCVFGHVHNAKRGIPIFGKKGVVTYEFVAGDYLDFHPKKIQ